MELWYLMQIIFQFSWKLKCKDYMLWGSDNYPPRLRYDIYCVCLKVYSLRGIFCSPVRSLSKERLDIRGVCILCWFYNAVWKQPHSLGGTASPLESRIQLMAASLTVAPGPCGLAGVSHGLGWAHSLGLGSGWLSWGHWNVLPLVPASLALLWD